jgi:aminoglycoside/choline kinase family phosphotransferase
MIESPHLDGNGIAMNRLELLRSWASALLRETVAELTPASEDASFRRYFRIAHGAGTLIAMDAPPPHENCGPYVHVAHLFRAATVNVPEIIAQDLERGFLLLTDFGSTTYLDAHASGDASPLYADANDALIAIQRASRSGRLPDYSEALLKREVDLFRDWYVARHLKKTLSAQQAQALERTCAIMLACNLAEPRVYVHRDYHSRNLMVARPNPGILDFQDAVYGPISYDLVSLLKDAYIEWPEEQVLDWAVRYWEKARAARLPVRDDFAEFYRDFEWMGIQRHLKVLGIFARLWHRDGKDRYLRDLPLVLRYTERAVRRYRELAPLARLLDDVHEHRAAAGLSF